MKVQPPNVLLKLLRCEEQCAGGMYMVGGDHIIHVYSDLDSSPPSYTHNFGWNDNSRIHSRSLNAQLVKYIHKLIYSQLVGPEWGGGGLDPPNPPWIRHWLISIK